MYLRFCMHHSIGPHPPRRGFAKFCNFCNAFAFDPPSPSGPPPLHAPPQIRRELEDDTWDEIFDLTLRLFAAVAGIWLQIWSQNISTFILMAKIPKYRQNIKIRMYFAIFNFVLAKFDKFRENCMKINTYFRKMANFAQN